MLNNFIYSKTKELFEEKLASNEVLDEAIVFIEDTKEIWNHGTYFGGASNINVENTSKYFFCDLRNVEIAGRIEENDIDSYIITEENSQSVFGTSISELYNTLVPKGTTDESGKDVVSDWNLNEIPVVLFTPDGYLLNPTTYAFGDAIGIMYESGTMLTDGYNRIWHMQITESSVYIINMPLPQKSYITFTIPDSYTLGETLILNESDIKTACGLSYNQFKIYGTLRPIELHVLGHSILEWNRYVSNISFVAPGAGFVLITNDENKTITLNSSYEWGYVTKDYVDSQIESAITNALNTEV